MRSDLSDNARLQHILEAISEIESYVQGIDFNLFVKDSKTRFATIKQLEIGEAVNHLTPSLLEQFNEINWRAVQSFRNVMVHEYFSVNIETVWNTVFEDLPPLKSTVSRMLNKAS
jgi:uncharacterized protein with HEPN domain